jgi:D-alanyl-D-alanine carboxypeptidase
VVVSKDKRARIMYGNTNLPLVTKRFDVVGGKTGFTKIAGYCYVTAARFAGREVLLAFLGAEGKATRFDDFNRVAAWLANGNLTAKLKTTKRPEKRVANP